MMASRTSVGSASVGDGILEAKCQVKETAFCGICGIKTCGKLGGNSHFDLRRCGRAHRNLGVHHHAQRSSTKPSWLMSRSLLKYPSRDVRIALATTGSD